jgi:RNA-directed DNA polymerase
MSAQRAMNVRNKVSDLQTKLFHVAKQTLDRKFGALYDKVYREDVMLEAWKRVRANKGAAGVDGQDFEYIENEIGVKEFLEEIRQELKRRRYRAQPVRRCYVDKRDSSGKRPLGIPVIKDRVVQMAVKLVIEPIFEANFLNCSYGFRPKRSAHRAIKEIKGMLTFKGQRTVIDADIKGFFDNICHEIMMRLVRRRISDPRILKLIEMWLRAGVMEEGKYIRSDGTGTPQGGVLSPLLSNIYLHSFDRMFQMSGIAGTLVRYCDDFVILVRRDGKQVQRRVEQMLKRLRLQLNKDKTRIVDARDGFDFLGVHFRMSRIGKKGVKIKEHCVVWPSDRSMKRIRRRIKEVISRRYELSLEELIRELNPVIRGWNNYHTAIRPIGKRLRKLNPYAWDRIRIFLKRKYGDQSRGTRRAYGDLIVRLGLHQFG